MENIHVTKEIVVESPKDTVLDGVIVEAYKTTWREIIDPKKIENFNEPDKEIVQLKWQTKYKDKVLSGDDTFAFYKEPMSNSKMGKFLLKYSELGIGIPVKIIFSGEGFGTIKLD